MVLGKEKAFHEQEVEPFLHHEGEEPHETEEVVEPFHQHHRRHGQGEEPFHEGQGQRQRQRQKMHLHLHPQHLQTD